MMTDFEELDIHGCFRCGEINGEFEYDEMGFAYCLHCDERSIVSFRQSLDLLNDFYIRGHAIIEHPEDQEGL